MLKSQEIYAEYKKQKLLEDKLAKRNRGLNLVNADNVKASFHIHVKQEVKQTLNEYQSKIVVETDLPIDWYSWRETNSVENFLSHFESWAKIPRYAFVTIFNRKKDHAPDTWRLPKFRDQTIRESEVQIEIGEEAQKSLPIDFVAEIQRIIALQREPTEKERHDFERFWILWQSVDDIKRQAQNSGKSYGYSEQIDKTIHMEISIDEYNRRMKSVEQELLPICKRYGFLKMPQITYLKRKKVPTKKQFLKENNEDLEEAWEQLDDKEKDEHDGDFKNFCEFQFNEWKEANEDFEEERPDYEDDEEEEEE